MLKLFTDLPGAPDPIVSVTGRVKAENGVLPPLTYNYALPGTLLSRGDFMPLTAPISPVSPPPVRPLIMSFCARV